MARTGCIGVAGGLETASDRLLRLMDKGITIEQAVRACRSLTRSGILVHAYLMYGLPTETEQETIDSLERVRQIFELGYIRSVAWGRYIATIHSPVAKNPSRYGIRLRIPDRRFACYRIPYEDPTPYDHELLGAGLKRVHNGFIMGLGLDRDVRSWFAKPLAPPNVPPDFIRSLAPPDAGEDRHWRLAGADWTDRPRHGFQVPNLVTIRTDGEDFILTNLGNETSYRFEGIGAECWRLLAEGLAVTEIAERLAAAYAAPREQVLTDISTLIDELCENGLLQRNYG